MFFGRTNGKYRVGFGIGLLLAALHFVLALLAFSIYVRSRSSTAALVFIWFIIPDAPLLLLPYSTFEIFGTLAPLIQFGILGSLLWFLIPWLMDVGLTRLLPKPMWAIRAAAVFVMIPLVLVAFSFLSRYAVRHQIEGQRPEEVKESLNLASSEFLSERIVFESGGRGGINHIARMDLEDGAAIVVSLADGVVFLDETYQSLGRLDLPGPGFNRIEPFRRKAGDPLAFLACRHGRGVYLFDRDGNEEWALVKPEDAVWIVDEALPGDVDGDGTTEFVIFHSYREGIWLVDGSGEIRWKHPVYAYALGHLEIADLNGDGADEILYSNSNNIRGMTEFHTLDGNGTLLRQQPVATKSFEFDVIRWPGDSGFSILLTEENALRVVDLEGRTLHTLEAPGCRFFGKVQAQTIRFEEDRPAYLAVLKMLHPDLLALYVYDAGGKSVYRKTEVVKFGRTAVLTVSGTGRERLLVGSSRDRTPTVIEYSFNEQ